MKEAPAYFQKLGIVNVDKNKGEGRVLITESFFFALRNKNAGEKIGRHFGLLGIWIGGMIDARKAKASPPQYLEHPDLAVLPAKVKKDLQKTELLGFMPLGEGFTVTKKFSGLDLHRAGLPDRSLQNFFGKGSVCRYLKKRGITVVK